ncbi:MAG: nitrate reductase molybdenum cofactor assembly chaperone [Desulfurococcales archaeon]|nr:nitrate reductase molybdenum cofactor assembly chaperone [Desulfurococcales archaeon]MEB3779636.1 nitrate reductase molybdenum cofactor assembly chaperone [Desulfurococcales archaeon]
MKYTLKTLSILLGYPQDEFRKLVENPEDVYELLSLEDEEIARLIYNFLKGIDPEKADEIYVSIFELPAKCPLYAHYYIVKDKEGELGRFLLEIKGQFKMHGYDIPAGKEIPDYLPAMLEFLSLIVERDKRSAAKFAKRYIKTWTKKFKACVERNNRVYLPVAEALDRVMDKLLESS